jgi:hypothetical protein
MARQRARASARNCRNSSLTSGSQLAPVAASPSSNSRRASAGSTWSSTANGSDNAVLRSSRSTLAGSGVTKRSLTQPPRSIYRDGVLRDSDLLDQSATGGPTIIPEHGDAPVRIGTRDFNSFFQGAISRVAIFDRRLTDTEQAALQTARAADTLDSAISGTAGLVGFWRLGASA